MKINTSFVLAAISLALGGCAMTRDGFTVANFGGGDQSAFVKMRETLNNNAKQAAASYSGDLATMPDFKPGMVLIGNVTSFSSISASSIEGDYKDYVNLQKKLAPNAPIVMTKEELFKQIAGGTGIETFSIPGVISRRFNPVLVPRDLKEKISFANSFLTGVFGTTGDLVVAKTNSDGIWVIQKILCHEAGNNYHSCAQKFTAGAYDANNGQEVSNDIISVVSNGKIIDPLTFYLLKK